MPIFFKYFNEDRKKFLIDFLQNTLHSQMNTLHYLGTESFIKDEYKEECERELKYENAMIEYRQYEEWKKNRNKKRAEMEEKFSFDGKHASHLKRLQNMAKEILETGKINVDRTNIDAEELLDIRNGKWTYEQLEESFNKSEIELNQLYEKSTLQKSPQINKINDLMISIIDDYLKENV
jgi:uncharacterized protein